MKIGVYGGTFDPPHLGHMEAARAAAEALGLDKLLLIPAAVPPHKALPPDAVAPQARLAMAAMVADGVNLELKSPGLAEASAAEMDRTGKSYTADTLAQLRERYPEDELWLLLGTDMFLSLQTWREPEKIISLAGIAAFDRTEADSGGMEGQARRLRERYGARVALVRLPRVMEISSTQVRELLVRNRVEARALLWCQVYGYILREGLYGVNADLKRLSDDDLRCASLSMVKAKRIPHIRGCEEEAVRLAERWERMPAWPGGRASSTTALSIWSWTSSWRCVTGMGSHWTSWSGWRSSFSTPRPARPSHGTFLESRRRSAWPSTGTPPEKRIWTCCLRCCIWPTTLSPPGPTSRAFQSFGSWPMRIWTPPFCWAAS